jgi:hypothetical protein
LRLSRDFFHGCGGWVKTAAAGAATANTQKMVQVFSFEFLQSLEKKYKKLTMEVCRRVEKKYAKTDGE